MKTYFVNDINKEFTDKVKEYIDKGYSIFTNSMGGNQGEKATVHFSSPDGKYLYRLSLDRFYSCSQGDGFRLVMREYAKPEARDVNDFDSWITLWESEGKEIESKKFYQISEYKKNFFGDEEAYKAASATRLMRQRRKYATRPNDYKDITSKATIKAILPWVKRQPKCTSTIPRDITHVAKVSGDVWNSKTRKYEYKTYYEVGLKNKNIRLGEH